MVDLKITTYPNTEVKLQGDKVARTLISDDQGVAIFKRLKGGTYTATAKGKSKQITVLDQQNEHVCQQVKDLPLKSKIKFSSGLKMILMTKKPLTPEGQEHEPNVACLVSEFVTEMHKVTDSVYVFKYDKKWQKKLSRHYDELTWREKATIKPFFINESSTFINLYFYMLSNYEVGGLSSGDYAKYNFGFTDDASRIKKLENGSAKNYWLRGMSNEYHFSYNIVGANGKYTSETINYSPNITAGIVPACDISQDAYVTLDSDGYYRILGM